MLTRRTVIAGLAGCWVALASGACLRAQNIESPVTVIEGLEPVLLKYGQYTVGAEINTSEDIDRYEFFGEVGDVVDFNVDNLGLNPRMRIWVRDPNGVVVVNDLNDSNGGDFRPREVLAQRGTFSILVQLIRPSPSTGAYVLKLEKFPGALERPELHRLYYGTASYTDEISPAWDTDFFIFNGVATTVVHLFLEVPGAQRNRLSIWTEGGSRLVDNYVDSNGADFNTSFTVPEDGTYYVAVSALRFDQSGPYTLNLQCFSGPCPPIDQAVYQILGDGPNCFLVRLINNVPVVGGELSLGYDDSRASIAPGGITTGPDLPAAFDVDAVTGISLAGCPADPQITRGLNINWLDREGGGTVLQAGRRDLLRICFTPNTGSATCPEFKFLSCLGPTGASVENLVTHPQGGTIVAQTVNSSGCFDITTRFRRGDANGDTRFDVSDAIAVLICQFLSVGCTRCPVASDANDDGQEDVTDAIYLLNWRFHNGPAPKAPFPGCGLDPTAPSTEPCIEPVCI